MRSYIIYFSLFCLLTFVSSCDSDKASDTQPAALSNTTGLKIAFVYGDSILMNYNEFRKESDAMELKQRRAEEELQKKGAALEKEIMDYQKQAQGGLLTPKEMQAREKYLTTRQESVIGERDRMAQEIMEETAAINKRLHGILQEKLSDIKKKEGYDFILSYVDGGSLLIADDKYDITDKVLKELNADSSPAK